MKNVLTMLVLVLLACAGCARSALIPAGGVLLSPADTGTVVEALLAAQRRAEPIRRLYRVRQLHDGKGMTVRLAVRENPGELQFDIFPLTNFVALYSGRLHAAGGVLVRHADGQRTMFSNAEELSTQILGVSLSYHEITALLNGVLPAERPEARWEGRRTMNGQITLQSTDGRWHALLDPSQPAPAAIELLDALRQKPRLQVQYGSPRSMAPPKTLSVSLPRLDVRVELEWLIQPARN